MGFNSMTGVSVCNTTPAEAVGRLAAVSVARCFVALLMFFFAIVFPFACPNSNIGACDDANQHSRVKSGLAVLASSMNAVVKHCQSGGSLQLMTQAQRIHIVSWECEEVSWWG